MPTMNEVYDAAVLADAVYIDLPTLTPGTILTNDDLVSVLRPQSGTHRLTLAQAQYIAANYDLCATQMAGAGDFQGAVFRRKSVSLGEPGEYVFAIRGSQQAEDFYGADAQLTFADLAIEQTAAMYGFLQQLRAPIATGGYDLFGPLTRFDAVGHSLAGHLVQRLSAQNPAWVHAAFTFNGAGLGGHLGDGPGAVGYALGVQLVWKMFGGPSSVVANILSEPGIEVVPSIFTGPRLGTFEEIFTEDQTPVPPYYAVGNHLIGPQIDALAVYRTFEAVTGAEHFNLQDMRTILRAASNLNLASLETALGWLAQVFPGDGISSPIASEDREALHLTAQRIFAAVNGNTAYHLVDLAALSSDALKLRASQDTADGRAARYALVNGVSFIVTGADYSTIAASERYALDAGSDSYWNDRVANFGLLMARNLHDIQGVMNADGETEFSILGGTEIYTDQSTHVRLAPQGHGDPDQLPQVIFGSVGNDANTTALSGGSADDRIYGDLGDDQLYGNEGSDYLEGGAGNDRLVGGTGADRLYGGTGNDTYMFLADAQGGLINDADGNGSILVERADSTSYTLGSSTIREIATSPGHYEDEEGNRYQFNGSDLIVSLTGGRYITIDDFLVMGGAHLGLTLENSPGLTAPTLLGSTTYSITPTTPPNPPDVSVYGRYSPDASQPYAGWLSPGAVSGSAATERVIAPSVAGNRYYNVAGGLGDTELIGDAGQNSLVDDAVLLPDQSIANLGAIVGNDILHGGGGNDILVTHGGDDWSYGDDGNDILLDQPEAIFGSTQWVNASGHSNSDHLFGLVGNDVIAANGGSAYMDGGIGDDELYGGAHDDTLIGGDGADILSGDTRLRASPWTVSGTLGSLTVTENLNGIWDGEQAEAGNDSLFGDAGSDVLIGGLGNDFLDGGADADHLQGDLLFVPTGLAARFLAHQLDPGALHGSDLLWGGAGNDYMYGGGGSDHLYGEGDNDVLFGDDDPQRTGFLSSQYHGDDYLDGGAGADYLYGNGGADHLLGGDGNDFAFGGIGDDTIEGGAGADYMVGDDTTGAQGSDTIRGGDGDDTLFGLGGADLLYGDAGTDTISGGDGDDVIDGGDGDDYSAGGSSIGLFGGGGNDILRGGLGRDRLQGGAGNDTLEADSGSDLLFGGADDDTYVLSLGAGHVQITDTEGTSTLRFGRGIAAADLHVSMGSGVVYVDYGAGDWAFMDVATFGAITSVQLTSGVSVNSDALRHEFTPGVLGTDKALALAAGVAPADIGEQRWNDDLLLTYAGSVPAWVDTSTLASRNVMFEQRSGSDFGLSASTQVLVLTNWYQANSSSYISKFSQGGVVTGDFAALAASATRTLAGTVDSDALIGSGGAEALIAGAGADLLDAGAGDDHLNGDAGDDLLEGGLGNDTYHIDVESGSDVLFDDGGSADVVSFGAGIGLADLTITESNVGLRLQIGAAEDGNVVTIVDGSLTGGELYSIEQFTFEGGSTLSLAQLLTHVTGNHRPTANAALADQTVGHNQPFTYSLPVGLFSDADVADSFTVEARLLDGQALPDWLTFNPSTMSFTGSPMGDDPVSYQIRVTARDAAGLEVGALFRFTYDAGWFTGTSGNDTIVGTAHADRIYSGDGNDTLDGQLGTDYLEAGAGADTLLGGAGDDRLVGGTGTDTLDGGRGADVYVFGANWGNDIVVDADGHDRIEFTADSGVSVETLSVSQVGYDLLLQSGSNSVLLSDWFYPMPYDAFGYGNIEEMSILQGGVEYVYSANQLRNMADGYEGGAPHATPSAGAYLALNAGSTFTYQLPENLFSDIENQQDVSYTFYQLPAWLTYDTATRTLSGTVPAGVVNNQVLFIFATGHTSFWNDEHVQLDILSRPELNTQIGTNGDDVFTGTYNNYVLGGAGNDVISLSGDNIVESGDGNDTITILRGDWVLAGAGADNIHSRSGDARTNIWGEAGNDHIVVDSSQGMIDGGNGDDYLAGGLSIYGGDGDDTILGTGAANNLYGGEGNDYISGGSGADHIEAGSGDNTVFGGGDDDYILAGDGNNVLDGGTGNDTIRAGYGDDTFVGFSLDSGNDRLGGGIGRDTLEFSPTANIRIDQIVLSNAHIGDDFHMTLNSGSGNSISLLIVVASNGYLLDIEDFVLYNNGMEFHYTAEQLIAQEAEINLAPVDGMYAPVQSLDLGQSFSVAVPENLFFDAGSQFNFTYSVLDSSGQPLPSWISFDPLTATLSGMAGAAGITAVQIRAQDEGGLSAVSAIWLDIDGNQIMGSSSAETLAGSAAGERISGLEGNDLINGLAGDDILDGGAGDDQLDGGAGADQMSGGAGNDLYIVDHLADHAIENANEGIDSVQASVSLSLRENVENLTLTGSAAINGTGNYSNNTIIGNAASNTLTGGYGDDWLDGGTGADHLVGGFGSDTFVIDDAGDTISDVNDLSRMDINTVRSYVSSYTFSNDVDIDVLVMLGTANINSTGTGRRETIIGNSGNNVLIGGGGDDALIGGAGNDTYGVDNIDDVVTENAGEGTDLVQASISYVLGDNFENLTLTGGSSSTISGTGNALGNILTGNSGANTLTGYAGNDTLSGGSGSDTMIGGLGNDTYVVAQAGDVVTEVAGEGIDLVQSTIAYTLGNEVENLTLGGSSGLAGTGNALNNVIIGNSGANTLTGNDGNDTLDGGTGNDTMVGGQGNDVYFVNATGDVTTESAGQGIDTVNSAVTRSLSTTGADIELLFLTGTNAINGTGNSLSNLLRGNSGVNTLVGSTGVDILEGGGGNDILSNTANNTLLNGGAGIDTLTGTAVNDLLIGGIGNDAITTGTGADIIAFNKGDGVDTVAVSTTRDNTVCVGGGAVYADLLFQKSGNDLILSVAASDRITFTGYYANSANRSVNSLQVVIEGTADYNSGSSDALHNKKIETFNFEGLFQAFETARAATPGLTSWALTNALLVQHLSGSDTAALGGDLAYLYGRTGSLSDISFTPAVGVLGAAVFGTSAQALQSLASLQDATARLS